MARPERLRGLVARYEALQVQHAQQGSFETHRAMEDAAYTLCVSTGTRTVDSALAAAARQMAAVARPVTAAAADAPQAPAAARLTA